MKQSHWQANIQEIVRRASKGEPRSQSKENTTQAPASQLAPKFDSKSHKDGVYTNLRLRDQGKRTASHVDKARTITSQNETPLRDRPSTKRDHEEIDTRQQTIKEEENALKRPGSAVQRSA